MAKDKIIIKGAREHNLKNIDLEIPRDKLVVFTGLSGSGKSSPGVRYHLRRRTAPVCGEPCPPMPGMFLGQMEKPDVDYIEGLSPAISIDQKTTSKNPRSTVGTVTEIYDYLRLLYARIGIPHCPICGKVIEQQTVDQMVDKVHGPAGGYPHPGAGSGGARQRKGEHAKEFEIGPTQSGYVRVRVDGNLYDLSEEIKLEKNKKHTIEIVVDRLVVKEEIRSRLADSLETALGLTGGIAMVDVIGGEEIALFPELRLSGPRHQHRGADPADVLLQQPLWRLSEVYGPGHLHEDRPRSGDSQSRSSPSGRGPSRPAAGTLPTGGIAQMYYDGLAKHYGFSLDTPVKDLPKETVDIDPLRNQRGKA